MSFLRIKMTKTELFKLMRLLSALESILLFRINTDSRHIPDYLIDDIAACTEILEREITR